MENLDSNWSNKVESSTRLLCLTTS